MIDDPNTSRSESLIELKNIDDELEDLIQEINEDKEKKEEKKILLYKPESVSIFKFICHLSGKLEIFF